MAPQDVTDEFTRKFNSIIESGVQEYIETMLHESATRALTEEEQLLLGHAAKVHAIVEFVNAGVSLERAREIMDQDVEIVLTMTPEGDLKLSFDFEGKD